MPICTFTTNLSNQSIPANFGVEFAQQVADMLNKPFQEVTVIVHTDTHIVRAGTTEPAAVADINSIFTFDIEKTVLFIENIRNFVNEKLGLEKNRVIVLFRELKPEQVGRR